MQCVYMTKLSKRCKNTTLDGNTCHIHSLTFRMKSQPKHKVVKISTYDQARDNRERREDIKDMARYIGSLAKSYKNKGIKKSYSELLEIAENHRYEAEQQRR